jgi:hypothetical protein
MSASVQPYLPADVLASMRVASRHVCVETCLGTIVLAVTRACVQA